MNETCVCCGDVIPEGRQVCPSCIKELRDYKPKGVKTTTIGRFVFTDKKSNE